MQNLFQILLLYTVFNILLDYTYTIWCQRMNWSLKNFRFFFLRTPFFLYSSSLQTETERVGCREKCFKEISGFQYRGKCALLLRKGGGGGVYTSLERQAGEMAWQKPHQFNKRSGKIFHLGRNNAMNKCNQLKSSLAGKNTRVLEHTKFNSS